MPVTPAAPIERLLARVDTSDPIACWIPTGSNTRYATISGPDGATLQSHRVSYEHFVGPIPDGHEIDHVKAVGCTSTLCVNPAHLEAVTPAENVHRRSSTRLTSGDADAIRADNRSQSVIAAQFGIDQSHVSRIKNNKTWRKSA